VQAVADSRAATLSSLLQLVNVIVSGRLPHLPALLDGCLIPIYKSPSNSIRPIAILEVWTLVAALYAQAACPDIGPSVKPLQQGVGVRGGSQAMGHALCSVLYAKVESVLVQIDFKNAFNSVSRDALNRGGGTAPPTTPTPGLLALRPAFQPLGGPPPVLSQ
jgi:hypothetical protein